MRSGHFTGSPIDGIFATMDPAFENKSTVDEIRRRRQRCGGFSWLETGQQATIDAPLVLDLVAAAARTHLTAGGRILDLGCRA